MLQTTTKSADRSEKEKELGISIVPPLPPTIASTAALEQVLESGAAALPPVVGIRAEDGSFKYRFRRPITMLKYGSIGGAAMGCLGSAVGSCVGAIGSTCHALCLHSAVKQMAPGVNNGAAVSAQTVKLMTVQYSGDGGDCCFGDVWANGCCCCCCPWAFSDQQLSYGGGSLADGYRFVSSDELQQAAISFRQMQIDQYQNIGAGSGCCCNCSPLQYSDTTVCCSNNLPYNFCGCCGQTTALVATNYGALAGLTICCLVGCILGCRYGYRQPISQIIPDTDSKPPNSPQMQPPNSPQMQRSEHRGPDNANPTSPNK
jgi:hypothetical protein